MQRWADPVQQDSGLSGASGNDRGMTKVQTSKEHHSQGKQLQRALHTHPHPLAALSPHTVLVLPGNSCSQLTRINMDVQGHELEAFICLVTDSILFLKV